MRSRLSWMNEHIAAGPEVCQPWDGVFHPEDSSERQDVIRDSQNRLAACGLFVARTVHPGYKARQAEEAMPTLSPTVILP